MTITPQMAVRIVPVGRQRSAGAVIFLEDSTRIQNEARQMKLAALGRLTANIAHEIRNPLGAISHATELLQEEPASTDTAKRLITIIHDNTERLNRMVNDVLKLRRSDSVHREEFKVVDYLRVFVEQFCQIEENQSRDFRPRAACRAASRLRPQSPEPGDVEPVSNALRHAGARKAAFGSRSTRSRRVPL